MKHIIAKSLSCLCLLSGVAEAGKFKLGTGYQRTRLNTHFHENSGGWKEAGKEYSWQSYNGGKFVKYFSTHALIGAHNPHPGNIGQGIFAKSKRTFPGGSGHFLFLIRLNARSLVTGDYLHRGHMGQTWMSCWTYRDPHQDRWRIEVDALEVTGTSGNSNQVKSEFNCYFGTGQGSAAWNKYRGQASKPITFNTIREFTVGYKGKWSRLGGASFTEKFNASAWHMNKTLGRATTDKISHFSRPWYIVLQNRPRWNVWSPSSSGTLCVRDVQFP